MSSRTASLWRLYYYGEKSARARRSLLTTISLSPPSPPPHPHRFKNCPATGINHQLSNLDALLSEAALLRRTPVVHGPCLHKLHNDGITLSETRWSDYRDIDNVVVWARKRIAADVEADSPERLDRSGWFKWSWFDQNPPPSFENDDESEDDGIGVVRRDVVQRRRTNVPWLSYEAYKKSDVEKANKHNTRILMPSTILTPTEMDDPSQPRFLHRYMGNVKGGLWKNSWQLAESPYEFRVELPPSSEVAKAAALIKATLRGWSADGTYVALHVRRGDRLKQTKYREGQAGCPQGGSLANDTAPDAIARRMKKLLGITPSLDMSSAKVIYVMSDERGDDHWRPLETCCGFNVKRDVNVLADHPAHATLLAELRAKDNYLLYEVEKVVFDGAATRVHTFSNKQLWPNDPALSKCNGHS